MYAEEDGGPFVRQLQLAMEAFKSAALEYQRLQARYWLLEARVPDIESDATLYGTGIVIGDC